MSRRSIELEPGWLLAQRPYRDSSQLLEVFTSSHGRVGLVARGVRTPKSRLRGVLQPFAPLLLSWQAGGELGTLRSAEAGGHAVTLHGERVFHGWYVNELLLRLLPRDDPHPYLYAVYETLLPQLAGSVIEAEIALRLFEKRLLADLGYGLRLPEALDPQARYRYEAEIGAVRDAAAGERGYAGTSLIALREERLDEITARRDARRLLRAALRVQLGDRELESARLLRQLRGKLMHFDKPSG
jgi:DNA repair protein RecO (recombination protein O)